MEQTTQGLVVGTDEAGRMWRENEKTAHGPGPHRAAFGIFQKELLGVGWTRVSKLLPVPHFVIPELVPQSRQDHPVIILASWCKGGKLPSPGRASHTHAAGLPFLQPRTSTSLCRAHCPRHGTSGVTGDGEQNKDQGVVLNPNLYDVPEDPGVE